jgi:hypothetical protein
MAPPMRRFLDTKGRILEAIAALVVEVDFVVPGPFGDDARRNQLHYDWLLSATPKVCIFQHERLSPRFLLKRLLGYPG